MALIEASIRKFPLRRVEPFLKKCLKKLEMQLNDMRQHKLKISQLVYSKSGGAERGTEYTDTAETVNQLITAVGQFEQIRRQVIDADITALDYQLAAAFEGLVLVLFDFLQLRSDHQSGTQHHDHLESELQTDTRQQQTTKETEGMLSVEASSGKDAAESPGNSLPVAETELPLISDVDMWTKCQEVELKLLELNDVLQNFLKLIDHNTQPVRETENVSSATTPDHDRPLSFNMKNFNLKLLMLPVAGAVLGGAIAGPVGLVAGLKVGKIAAVGGGLIGLTGGTLLKKRKESESGDQAAVGNAENAADNEASEMKESNPMTNVL